jgi:hypothetical protein
MKPIEMSTGQEISRGSFSAPCFAPKIFSDSIFDCRHGGIFLSPSVPTYSHGPRGDPHILNINKKIIYFGQNYDGSMTLFLPFLLKNTNIFMYFF